MSFLNLYQRVRDARSRHVAAIAAAMLAKLDHPRFMADIRPLLPADISLRSTDQVILEHFVQVLRCLIAFHDLCSMR
jgi:hypothetical protein